MEKPKPEFRRAILTRKLTEAECNHSINKGINLKWLLAKEPGATLYFLDSDVTNHYFHQEGKVKRGGIRLRPNRKNKLYLIPRDAFVLEA